MKMSQHIKPQVEHKIHYLRMAICRVNTTVLPKLFLSHNCITIYVMSFHQQKQQKKSLSWSSDHKTSWNEKFCQWATWLLNSLPVTRYRIPQTFRRKRNSKTKKKVFQYRKHLCVNFTTVCPNHKDHLNVFYIIHFRRKQQLVHIDNQI